VNNLHSSKILLVEPDAALGDVMRRFLLKSDIEAVVVNDAQTAISTADTLQPDLVVLEIAMAEHNGIAFLQEFRSYVDWMELPIIIYSNIPREDIGLSNLEWQKLGVVEYLYKTTTRLVGLSNAVNRHVRTHETA